MFLIKRSLLFLGLCIAIPLNCFEDFFTRGSDEHHVKLESPVIKFIDGKSFGINGERFGMILQIRKRVKEMLFGDLVNGQLVGKYTFNGQKHSVHTLAQVEPEVLASNDSELITQFKQVMLQSLRDFNQRVQAFMEHARGAKSQMTALISESCHKRERMDSYLLKGSEAKEAEEDKQFVHDVTTFAFFDTLCTDIVNFLEDLLRACPIAQSQFIQRLEEMKKLNKQSH